jgi:Type I phosphodiesterase / nucleotide pyrophosphatase
MSAKTTLLALLIGFSMTLQAQNSSVTDQFVILITLDGLRWQEVFEGADSTLLFKDAPTQIRRWWHTDSRERRRRLMPFIWENIAQHGQVHGNRRIGSLVNLANRRCVSYPGYNEMLCGFPDDQRVLSNLKIPNPNINLLEMLEQMPEFKGQTAVFASWDHFSAIYNTARNQLMVNSAFEPMAHDSFLHLNSIATRIPRPWKDKVRPDWLTTAYAQRWMSLYHPKVMHIALGETDEFGHEKDYEHYLDAAYRSDSLIAQLWQQVQNDPFYSGRTTLLITTDHGRGATSYTWHKHNARIVGSDEVWLAAIGPQLPDLGEICREQYTLGQMAATVARLLHVSQVTTTKMLPPIDCLFTPETPGTPLLSEQFSPPAKK